MPLRSASEILLRRTGIRIGYDFLRESHVLILDADLARIEAKPLEEAQSANEALTLHVHLAGRPLTYRLNDALIVHTLPDNPGRRIELLHEKLSSITLSRSEPSYEKNVTVYEMLSGLHMIIEPEAKFVRVSISPDIERKAEALQVYMRRPTLINTLFDRMQRVSVIYVEPVRLVIEDHAGYTVMNVEPRRPGAELGRRGN